VNLRSMLHATQVFTPDSLPTLTFVNRSDVQFEDELLAVSRAAKVLVSLSGPSKSGKTVLLERVIGHENLIKISGAGISEAEDVWRAVLAKLGAPLTVQTSSSQFAKTDTQAKMGMDGGIPLLGGAKAEASLGRSRQTGSEIKETVEANLLYEVERRLAGKSQFVLLDDFHYIVSRDVQVRLAQQIKDMFERGVKIAVVQVHHRRDDVLRSNPELRGRLRPFEFHYWNHGDLVRIAKQGFPYLHIDVPTDVLDRFASEAAGSPQLMQQICLQTCVEMKIFEPVQGLRSVQLLLTASQLERIFKRVARTSDYGALCDALADGPKERGRARNAYERADGRPPGDTYELILDSVALDPPSLRLTVDDFRDRMKLLCKGDAPRSGQIINSCAQIKEIVDAKFAGPPAIEWNPEHEVLDIVDPYLMFYLRWGR
jgi:hypothetical protein